MSAPGIHIQKPSLTSASREWAKVAKCVKHMDSTAALQLAPSGAIRVYRKYFPNQDWTGNPYQQGQNIANNVIGGLGGYRHPNLYIEAYNEPPGHKLKEGLEQHVEFTKGFVQVAHSQGIKVAGFSFSTGTPTRREDVQYLVAHNWAGVDALSTHQYWGNQGLTVWHALRHRTLWEWAGGRNRVPQIIITETGREDVEGGGRGWKASGVTPAQYWQEILNFDRTVSGEVLGYNLFTGSPNSTWPTYDHDPFWGVATGKGPLPEHKNEPGPKPPEPEPGEDEPGGGIEWGDKELAEAAAVIIVLLVAAESGFVI